MGLFSARHNPSRQLSSVPRLVLFFAFCCLPLLLLIEVDNFVSQTKTIAGHNLEPTPWHIFPPKPSEEESKYTRASTIIRCTYLTCGQTSASNSSYPDHSRQSEDDQPMDCPEPFGYIQRDLEPWVESKISMFHIIEAQKYAAFRVVIIGGKLYVDFYYACVQSRAMFTVWGILQLLRRYPGKIPDLDLMFDCMDKPTINRTEHASMPLPLFRYCTTPEHMDIPFPDWSFWGWSEINIRPWDEEFRSIKKGSKRRNWSRKYPFAYWKGNPDVVSPIRLELLQCNDTQLWGAQILRQDWEEETKLGFKTSKLAKQCDHRYKIYAEGYAWSVSLKYILSCGCCPLIISPQYQDFFSRGLVPHKNYLPIPSTEMCPAIKFAVDWGNSHPSEAEAIGRAAQEYMGSLSMDRVYDYMYHLLTGYSKLQAFVPVRPSTAMEICEESVLCFANEKQRKLLRKSVASASSAPPCSLPLLDSL
ncbi:O-glucosyltransferase rumi homolog [Sesamum indicum]|uniref:O-glucosyltransferase rumi homolog n=1 Tax=Sesamum indicum TaxID=4182 RepID=A0A6I9T8L1_SESIN|nr:O-glucosyltransferase rumi homolog [Sesamum indicum]